MNRIVLMGRLATDPDIRRVKNASGNETVIASYRIAVPRRFKREGQPDSDFFNVTVFAGGAVFAEKYLKKGTKICLEGELQNNNYENKEGKMVYRDHIIASNQEFAESKAASERNAGAAAPSGNTPKAEAKDEEPFMELDDEELPFA